MALLIPTRRDIASRIFIRMLGRDVPLTDFLPIGTTRILFEEGIVEELAQLHAELGLANDAWFIDGAKGEDLDRRLSDYGLTRPEAQAATGEVTYSANGSGATIAAGAQVKTAPTDPDLPVRRYLVGPNPATADRSWTIPANGSAKVRIVSQEAGEVGNTAANTITAQENGNVNVAITNELPVVNGRNHANDDEFREYFRSWLLSLAGGTRGALIHRVLTYLDPTTAAPAVHSVSLQEWDGTTLLGGNVALRIWIDDGTGTATSTTLEAIQALVDGRDTEANPGLRGAGLPALVVPATPFPVDVNVTIDVERTVSAMEAQDAVRATLERFLARVPVSGRKITGEVQGQLIFAQLFKAVMNVTGVLRATFLTPSNNITLQPGQKVMPGTITVHAGVVA